MELKIYNQSGQLKLTVSASSSSTWNRELMSEDALSVSFTHTSYVPLEMNDYAVLEGVRFSVKKEYKPRQKNRQTYSYSVKLYAPIHDAEQVLYLNLTDGAYEPQFSLNDTPGAHIQKWVDNMNRLSAEPVWSVGEVLEAAARTVEYNNTTCWDALVLISDAFEAEWWTDGFKINLCRCERGERVELGYMQGLMSLTQAENAKDVKFFTRLIPLGSTKNIDRSRYGYSRLQLPGREKYVDRNTRYGLYEHVEAAAFADIYPQYTGTVSAVRSEEKTDNTGKKYTVYYIHDEDMQFDPNGYEIAGLVKRISFQSGDLLGQGNSENGNYWFDANYNSRKLEWEIINIYPTEEKQIPGGNLVPRVGDKYIPWNIRMPESYEVQAELRYRAAVDSYLEKYSEDISKYGGDTDYVHIDKYSVPLTLGQRVRLLSDKYFQASAGIFDTRMTKVTRKLDNLSMAAIECTNKVGKGWKRSVEVSLSKLHYVVSAGGGSSSAGGASSASPTETQDKLRKDILVNSNDVGYIKKGDVVAAGQTWERILRSMLYRPVGAELRGLVSTGTDVEYGTEKGYITYTATRNGQGLMKEAYYDDNKANVLSFSEENSGIQTAVRRLSGAYTQRETYKATVEYAASEDGQLPEKSLTNTISVNVHRKWFAGVVDAVPTTSAQVRALSGNGFYRGAGTYKFSVGRWKTFVICVPAGTVIELTLTAYPGNFIEDTGVCSGPTTISVEGAGGSQATDYQMWVIKTDGINDADTFTFKTN